MKNTYMSNDINKLEIGNTTVTKILQIFAWPVAYILFKIFLSYKIKGADNIKKALSFNNASGIIFASNHSTELDAIIITAGVAPYTLWKPMFYVTAPMKNFGNEKFGWRKYIYGPNFFKAWGAYPIVQGARNYVNSLATHRSLLKTGNNICLFPEGGMSQKKEAHGGISYLANRTNSIIVPIHISGIEHLSTKDFFTRKRKLVITYMPPLLPEQHINDDELIPGRYQKSAKQIVETIYSIEKTS